MDRRRRRYYDSWETVKSKQHKARKKLFVVHDWEIEDMHVNGTITVLNKRRRSRIGHVEKKNGS